MYNKTSIEMGGWGDSIKKLPVSEPWLAFAGTFDVLLLCLGIYRKRRKYGVIEMVFRIRVTNRRQHKAIDDE